MTWPRIRSFQNNPPRISQAGRRRTSETGDRARCNVLTYTETESVSPESGTGSREWSPVPYSTRQMRQVPIPFAAQHSRLYPQDTSPFDDLSASSPTSPPPKTAHPQPTPDTYPTTHTTEPSTRSFHTVSLSRYPSTAHTHIEEKKTHQESPRPHKRRQRQRILHRPPVIHRKPQPTTQRKPNRPDQIPESHMPPQQRRRGDIPPLLHLDHEQQTRHHEPRAPHDLWKPVRAVLRGPRPQRGADLREGGEARDPEDGGAEELGEAGEEADFAEVVGG